METYGYYKCKQYPYFVKPATSDGEEEKTISLEVFENRPNVNVD
jgi:hypothetical protein